MHTKNNKFIIFDIIYFIAYFLFNNAVILQCP